MMQLDLTSRLDAQGHLPVEHTNTVASATSNILNPFDHHFVVHESSSSAKPSPSVHLLIDNPRGVAFRDIAALSVSKLNTGLIIVIITHNPCLEYSEDIWDLGPDALLVNPSSDDEISMALTYTAKGVRYRIAGQQSSLSRAERKILRHLALGECNRSIAVHLGFQTQTTMNMLSSIYSKLNVENRTQAALYYWGLLDDLKAQGGIGK